MIDDAAPLADRLAARTGVCRAPGRAGDNRFVRYVSPLLARSDNSQSHIRRVGMMRALVAVVIVALLLALVFATIGFDNHDLTPPGQPAAINPM